MLEYPPSTVIAEPVRKSDAELARKAAMSMLTLFDARVSALFDGLPATASPAL
jgi:hypothetical protein